MGVVIFYCVGGLESGSKKVVNFEVSHSRCIDKLYNQKKIYIKYPIWSEHNYI
jgi:hypothetical protein